MTTNRTLLEVDDLKKHFPLTEGIMKKEIGRVKAVDGVSFGVEEGETFGIVGESGCGKSTAARTILRLEEPTAGSVRFDGRDIVEYDRSALKRFRREAQMIFQDPDSSFDPRMSVGDSIAEPLIVHGMTDRKRRRRIVEQLLVRVGLQAEDIDRYPHELSGGQKQRVGLARALVLNPRLLVADEPVSALDVSIQAEILSLMDDLQTEFGLSILLISHNLGVVREICDRVGVMYLGEFVEVGPTEELFSDPQHPYTRALVSAIPSTDVSDDSDRVRLTGTVPDPSNPPRGCRFHTRCPEVIPPDEYVFEQATWRSVLDFKQRVASGELTVERLSELLSPEQSADEVDVPETLPVAKVERQLRTEYDLPETLEDARADEIFTTAVDHLANGRDDDALEVLREEFTTVCQESKPDLREAVPGHRNACHLADDRQDVPADELATSD
ncbi:ATP-binding cassette domain-containing protein [Halobacteria archaeon AArc-m2/3/4]|uniref:ATP-binding cassette domain-containing protein n=1 Tax=Natronoglomus mannanivorans TaxID=2979990 RepID=A0AAP3E0T9_9EURY|nr:ATP-binding cassette domain-containing protein [Halobacteria archaeon AArc-xg1-1]MCU4972645.1 ATP-binding cassette domain-containing protein [Halobacteria archaeon AArc-m2/3/4]